MTDFRLNTTAISQLLGDPDFYTACPHYLFMRAQGLAAVKQYNQAVLNKEECNGCSGKYREDRAYIAPALAAFIRITRELWVADPANLAPVRAFLVDRLGFRPAAILLYYKEGEQKRELRF